jgi:hypothetical protein
MTSDLAAAVWAGELKLGDTIYKWVKPGEQFRFTKDGSVYVKRPGGWCHEATHPKGRKFRTGARTGVYRVQPCG